jgi:hypothetical protein
MRAFYKEPSDKRLSVGMKPATRMAGRIFLCGKSSHVQDGPIKTLWIDTLLMAEED